MRFILFSLLLTLGLTANMDIYPSKECGLFNNLKHTENTHDLKLQLDRSYVMLRHHKGQYLVKAENENPAQRWVDDTCLTLRPLRSSPLYASGQKAVSAEKSLRSKQNLLALSWHNAFCETHRYKKECKRNFGSLFRSKPHEMQFVLHGLWPQPRNKVYCHVDKKLVYEDKAKRWREMPDLNLDRSVKDTLAKVMPGFTSDLHKHEWVKHGTCYGTDANRYFSDAASLVDQVNHSVLGKVFSQNIGKTITLKEVRNLADKAFGSGTGNRITFQCKRGLVTELWLHIGSGSSDLATLLKKGRSARSRCHKGRIDKVGFGR